MSQYIVERMFRRPNVTLKWNRWIAGDSEREKKVYTDCSQEFLNSTLKDFVCSELTNQYKACVVKGLSLQEVPSKDQAVIDKAKQGVICNEQKPFKWRGMKLGHMLKIDLVTNPIELLERNNGFQDQEYNPFGAIA